MKSIKKFFLGVISIAGIFSLEAQGQRVASPIPGVGDVLPLSLLEEEEMDAAPASGTTTIPEVGNVRSFQFRAPNQAAGVVSQQIGGGAAATVLPFLPRGVQPIPAQSRRPTIQPQVTSQVRALQSQERPQVQQVGQTQARAQVQTPQPPVKQQVQTPRVQTRQQIPVPQTQIRPQIRATQRPRNFSSLREYIGSQVPVQRVTRTVGRSGAEESKVVEERENPIPFVTASKPVQAQRSGSEEKIPETQRATPDVEESFYREQRGQPHHSSVSVVRTGHDRQAEHQHHNEEEIDRRVVEQAEQREEEQEQQQQVVVAAAAAQQQQHEASATALQQVGGHGGAGQIPRREEEQEGQIPRREEEQEGQIPRREEEQEQQQQVVVAAVHAGGALPLGAQPQQPQQDLAARRRAALLAVGRNFRTQQQAAAAAAVHAGGALPLGAQPPQPPQQVAAGDDDMFGGMFNDAPPPDAVAQHPLQEVLVNDDDDGLDELARRPRLPQQQQAAAAAQPWVADFGDVEQAVPQQQQQPQVGAGGILPFGAAQPLHQPAWDLDQVLRNVPRQRTAEEEAAWQRMEDELFDRQPLQQPPLPQPQQQPQPPVEDFADFFADMVGAPQQQAAAAQHQQAQLGGVPQQPLYQPVDVFDMLLPPQQQQQQVAAAAAHAGGVLPLGAQPPQPPQQVAAGDDDMFGGMFNDAPPADAVAQHPPQRADADAAQQQVAAAAAAAAAAYPQQAGWNIEELLRRRDQPPQQPERDLNDQLGLVPAGGGDRVDLQAMEDELFGRRPLQQQRHQPVDLIADLFAAGDQQQHQQQQQAAAAAAVAAAQPQPARVFGGVNSIQREVQEEVRRNVDQFRRATATVGEQQQLDKERQQLIGQIQDLSTHETVQQSQRKYDDAYARLGPIDRFRFSASREGHHPSNNQFAPVYAAFRALKKAKEEAADLQQANASRTHIEDELRQRSREFQQAQIQAHDSSNQLSAKTGEVLRHFDPAEASKILRRAEAQLAFPAAVALGLHRDGAPAQGFQGWEETLREKVEAKIQADHVARKTAEKSQARDEIVSHLQQSPIFQTLAREVYPGVDATTLSYAQKGALIKAYLGVTGRKADDPRGETWDDARYIAGQILPGGVTSWDEAVGNIRSCHDQEEMHRQQAAAAAADDDFDCP